MMHCVRIPVHCQPRRRVSPNQQSTGVRTDGKLYLLTTKLTGARNSGSFVPFQCFDAVGWATGKASGL